MNNIPAPIFEEFTLDTVKEQLATKAVSQSLVDKMNKLVNSQDLQETFKDNFITYTSVLTTGAYSPDQYVVAVQFVSYRLMGMTVKDAWAKTFPDRYAKLLQRGATAKIISSHCSAYNKSKLVNAITEQSLIPSYIINNHYFQEALDVQVEIMRDASGGVSPKVRSEAAGKVLEYTVMPDSLVANKEEVSEASIDIIKQLAATVNKLADGKLNNIIDGSATAQQMAREKIYGDIEDAVLVDE